MNILSLLHDIVHAKEAREAIKSPFIQVSFAQVVKNVCDIPLRQLPQL